MGRLKVFSICVTVSILACSAGIPNAVRGSGNVTTRQYQVSGFSEIELNTIGTVILTQGDHEALEIETDDNILQYLDVKVANGRLVIDDSGNVDLLPSNGVTYRLIAKGIDMLEVNSSGNMLADEVSSRELDLKVTGSGAIDLEEAYAGMCSLILDGSGRITVDDLECDRVVVDISASGVVGLGGETASLQLTSSGSGEAQLEDLKAAAVSATLDASGNATVWANEELDVSIAGSGSLSYFGTPNVESKLTGSGTLIPLGAHY